MENKNGIRETLRYIQKFKGITLVVYLNDNIFNSPLLSSHIRDIALLHDSGINIVVIAGARNHITEILDNYKVEWQFHDNIRITNESQINFIKMAAFDISNRIMSLLSGENKNAVIGNWVKSRGYGIIEGLDYGSAGKIDHIHKEALLKVLNEGFIPIVPCIGWSTTGKPYNISSLQLAVTIASELNAEKLFFLELGTSITRKDFKFNKNAKITNEGRLVAISTNKIDDFIQLNKKSTAIKNKEIFELFKQGKTSCLQGVKRVHILDANIDGVIPGEIFSELGSGTMIYKSDYGTFKQMERENIPQVLSLINPFVKQGILLPRTAESLEHSFPDYSLYEVDGGIRACGALHLYPNKIGEIAAIAVEQQYSDLGIGPQLMEHLLERAKSQNLNRIFVLTTQTADWFERFGFVLSSVDELPEKRRQLWNKSRLSKVLVKNL